MFTIEDYFKKLKFIKVAALPPKVKEGYWFVKQITEDYTTWKYYKADKKIKQKVDQYLVSLNEFISGKTKSPVTEAEAKEVAKELIRFYVHRGDSLESLASSQMGSYGGGNGAMIRKRKIEVEKVKGHRVNFAFSLPAIYVELMNERKGGANQKPNTLKHSKVAPKRIAAKTAPQPRKQEIKRQSPVPNEKPLRIDYSEAKPVELIGEEVRFIKRFLSFHNKEKTKQQILNFLNALKRAILEKRIRKASRYSKEIMQIQMAVAKKINDMEAAGKDTDKAKINDQALKHLGEIVGSVRVRLSIQYLKRFIGIQGKNITKEKAQALYDLVVKAIDNKKVAMTDPYFNRIKKVLNALKQFIKVAGKDETIEVHEEALSGLNGVLGCMCQQEEHERSLNGLEETDSNSKKKVGEVMSVEEARKKEYQPVNITGKWKELIGNFCLPTQFFVYGLGGSGKSSFVLLFTQYLASLGFKILYVAGEQFDTPTFTALLNKLNIVAGDHFKIVANIDTLNPTDFDFVVLDSKDQLEVDINHFASLMEKYPAQSFIVLSQAIKSGSFTGKERWRNIVDVMIQAENGIIRTGHDKNRWGGAGEMVIFNNRGQHLKASEWEVDKKL